MYISAQTNTTGVYTVSAAISAQYGSGYGTPTISVSTSTSSAGTSVSNSGTANITASLSEIPLDDSLQVFLNGMLQTRSGSAGAGIFDYEYVTDTNPRKVQLVAGVDEDDVVVLKYIRK